VDDSWARTERPTARRRVEARREGRVARSAQLLSACALGAGLVSLLIFSGRLWQELSAVTKYCLSEGAVKAAREGVEALAMPAGVWAVMRSFVYMAIVIFVATAIAGFSQVGPVFSLTAASPKLRRLSPSRGLSEMFGGAAWVRLGLMAAKVAAVILILRTVILRHVLAGAFDGAAGVGDEYLWIGEVVFWAVAAMVAVEVVVGLVDYAWQRWRYEKGLRMTRSELLRELQASEGAPVVLSRRRDARTEMRKNTSQARSRENLRATLVVLGRPGGTAGHMACVIGFADGRSGSPVLMRKVLGKGVEEVREMARREGIAVVVSDSLCVEVCRSVDVSGVLPPRLVGTVAREAGNVLLGRNSHYEKVSA